MNGNTTEFQPQTPNLQNSMVQKYEGRYNFLLGDTLTFKSVEEIL